MGFIRSTRVALFLACVGTCALAAEAFPQSMSPLANRFLKGLGLARNKQPPAVVDDDGGSSNGDDLDKEQEQSPASPSPGNALIAPKLLEKVKDGWAINKALYALMEDEDLQVSLEFLRRAALPPVLHELQQKAKEAQDSGSFPKGFTLLLPSNKAWRTFLDNETVTKDLLETVIADEEQLRALFLRHIVLKPDGNALWSTEIKFDEALTTLSGDTLTFSMCPMSQPAMVCVYYGDQTVPVEAANLGGDGFVVHRLGSILLDPAVFLKKESEAQAE